MPEHQDLPLVPYPGLPRGAFDAAALPPPATASAGYTDEGVWSAAVGTYLNVIDPQTSEPLRDQPLQQAAESAVVAAAAACHRLSMKYSEPSDVYAGEQVANAKGHLAVAVDNIEHAAGILGEPLAGPDGELTTGRQLRQLQWRDEETARKRSADGDSRHTQRMPESAWRLIAATMLGLLDVLLLWRPLLNLAWVASSASIFQWIIGGVLATLQVLFIEWAMRSFVTAERASTDRRGAVGDYNREIRGGSLDLTAPDKADVTAADARLGHAYHILVVAAGLVALIGALRVAVLAKRAALPVHEAALYATIVGLILGSVVILMAQLYCRGNLLGDRLEAESVALAELDRRIQHARGTIAQEREDALAALTRADLAIEHAARVRSRTVADSWCAMQLAWTWFGLPVNCLDYTEFAARALPVVAETNDQRETIRERLQKVNDWLADRPIVFGGVPVAALTAASGDASERRRQTPVAVRNPGDGELHIYGPQVVELPAVPRPPHMWMTAASVLTVAAAVVTAFLAPAPEGVATATELIRWRVLTA